MTAGWWTRRSAARSAGCGYLSNRELDAVLGGTLGTPRLAAFAAHRLAGCAPCMYLAADLEAFRHIAERGLLASERREFERTRAPLAAHLRQELGRHVRPARRSSWFPVALAAAAMPVLAIVGTPLMRRGATGPLEIGGARFEAMPFTPPPAVRGVSLDELWREAQQAYEAGAFAEAQTALERIVERDPASHDARLYRGVTLVMLERHDDALAVLSDAQRLAAAAGLAVGSHDYWIGVAELGRGDVAAARAAFERARDAGGPLATRAAEALAAIAAR
jgi:tetratricopeptide (TPR) repeat protein